MWDGSLLAEEAQKLSEPEDKGSRSYNHNPVDDRKGCDIEKFPTDGDDENLTEQNHQSNESEATASFEMERGTTGLEGTRVEHVPELEEDKDGEEHRKFDRCQRGMIQVNRRLGDEAEYLEDILNLIMLEDIEDSEQNKEEDSSDPYDGAPHRLIDDEGFARTGFLLHNRMRGRKRGERHRRESIHYEVDPKHLGNSQRGFHTHEGPEKHYETSSYVDCHLEEDEALPLSILA